VVAVEVKESRLVLEEVAAGALAVFLLVMGLLELQILEAVAVALLHLEQVGTVVRVS
jgi:hypothetical protein